MISRGPGVRLPRDDLIFLTGWSGWIDSRYLGCFRRRPSDGERVLFSLFCIILAAAVGFQGFELAIFPVRATPAWQVFGAQSRPDPHVLLGYRIVPG
jgi:hypothetical protein